MRFASSVVLGTLTLGLAATSARAQGAAPSPDPQPLAAGTVAPDFTLPAGTRYGVLRAPIHLADFKGKTVVLAFFYKARTRG
jgi:thioredoxin-dependent peroxiredoxin